jgi:hypothetical protein
VAGLQPGLGVARRRRRPEINDGFNARASQLKRQSGFSGYFSARTLKGAWGRSSAILVWSGETEI